MHIHDFHHVVIVFAFRGSGVTSLIATEFSYLGTIRALLEPSAHSRNPTAKITLFQTFLQITNTCASSHNSTITSTDTHRHAQPHSIVNASNNDSERIAFDETEDPFMALLQHLDPFIDELLTQPEFHRLLHFAS
jgi:hypothetical protein